MVTNPMDYVDQMAKAGASGFTFHVEVAQGIYIDSCFPHTILQLFLIFMISTCIIRLLSENWQELVKKIKAAGMRPGVALKPGTPVEQVYPLVLNYRNCCLARVRLGYYACLTYL